MYTCLQYLCVLHTHILRHIWHHTTYLLRRYVLIACDQVKQYRKRRDIFLWGYPSHDSEMVIISCPLHGCTYVTRSKIKRWFQYCWIITLYHIPQKTATPRALNSIAPRYRNWFGDLERLHSAVRWDPIRLLQKRERDANILHDDDTETHWWRTINFLIGRTSWDYSQSWKFHFSLLEFESAVFMFP